MPKSRKRKLPSGTLRRKGGLKAVKRRMASLEEELRGIQVLIPLAESGEDHNRHDLLKNQ